MTSHSITIYTPLLLAAYNIGVHGISNSAVWRCPTRALRSLYGTYSGRTHLDVGVGTGYLLDHTPWPVPVERLVCLDASGHPPI